MKAPIKSGLVSQILTMVFLFTGCGVEGEITSTQPPGSGESFSHVTLSPAHTIANPGETLVQTVEVKDLGNTYFSAFDISYNPEVIEFVNIKEGTFMNRGGQDPTSLEVAFDNGIPGRLTVGLSRLGMVGEISGSGTLLTLEFRAIKPGSTTLTFSPPLGFKDSHNQLTPVMAWNNGSVTVDEEFF